MAQHIHADAHVDGVCLTGRVAHHQGLCRIRGEILASVADAVLLVADGGHRLAERQTALVVSDVGRGSLVGDHQIAERQVGAKRLAVATQRLPSQVVAPTVVTAEKSLAHLAQFLRSTQVVGLGVGLSRPERSLVQGHRFLVHATIDHGAQTSIAQRQRPHPFLRGLVVRQHQRCFGSCGTDTNKHGQ